MNKKERLITAREAASRLGLHPKAMYRFARAQKLSLVRLDPRSKKTIRFIESEIDRFIAARIAATQKEASHRGRLLLAV